MNVLVYLQILQDFFPRQYLAKSIDLLIAVNSYQLMILQYHEECSGFPFALDRRQVLYSMRMKKIGRLLLKHKLIFDCRN